jgi:hypothetical protein
MAMKYPGIFHAVNDEVLDLKAEEPLEEIFPDLSVISAPG